MNADAHPPSPPLAEPWRLVMAWVVAQVEERQQQRAERERQEAAARELECAAVAARAEVGPA